MLLLYYCELLDLYMWKSNLYEVAWSFYFKGIIHLNPCIRILKYSRPWVALKKWYYLHADELKGDATFLIGGKFDSDCVWRLKEQFSNWIIMKNNRTGFQSTLSCDLSSAKWPGGVRWQFNFRRTDIHSTKPLPKLTTKVLIWEGWRT